MLQEFMFFVGLLLALYGLSCIISSVVLWFSVGKNPKGELFIIPVSEESLIKPKIGSSLERLKNCGMGNVTTVMVVDCGLPLHKQEGVEQYCRKKDVMFCKREELANYLKNPPFQKEKNTV